MYWNKIDITKTSLRLRFLFMYHIKITNSAGFKKTYEYTIYWPWRHAPGSKILCCYVDAKRLAACFDQIKKSRVNHGSLIDVVLHKFFFYPFNINILKKN